VAYRVYSEALTHFAWKPMHGLIVSLWEAPTRPLTRKTLPSEPHEGAEA